MKKRILSIIILIAVLMTFVSCKGNKNNNPDSEKTVYETLNDLSKQSYDKVNLNITTLTDDITLNAFYVLTGNDVSYSIDQLNLLPTDNDFSHLDSNYKTTIKGSAIIKDGRVVKLNNDDVNISTFSELRGNFIFNEENFNNVIVENGYFSADVISPSDFWGMKKDVRDMKIVINYNNSALEIITITYKTSNSEVTTVYMFS